MTDEYIRREDAVKECGEWYVEEGTEEGFIGTVSQMLDMFSPADVVQVVHARWIKPTGMMPPEHHGHYECSECGAWAGRDWLRPWKEILLTDFCPGCGAKMDAG